MTECDKENFAKLVISICEIYEKKFSKSQMVLYWRVLKIFSYEEVEEAFFNHVSDTENGSFFPKPSQVVFFIKQKNCNDLKTSAMRAWVLVTETARRFGCGKTISFEDEKIHAVINALGGWKVFLTQSGKEILFLQKRFEEFYLFFSKNDFERKSGHVFKVRFHNDKHETALLVKYDQYFDSENEALECQSQKKLGAA